VGRAKEISGPYVDQDGKPMLGGGGTLVYDGSARWHGPGGQSIFVEGDTYYLVYHSYDADYNDTPTLRIEKLSWDQANWPVAPSALAGE
jgi:arabinan endo-1,5-alpha-L-arabinosidase